MNAARLALALILALAAASAAARERAAERGSADGGAAQRGVSDRDAETAAAAYFERIRAQPPQLRAFVQAMPKGGDLHSHLSGAVYAEDYLRWAGEDGLCLQREDAHLAEPPCQAPARVAVAEAMRSDLPLYGRAIDTMSVRGYERGGGDPLLPVHQRFFSAFDRFRPVSRRRTGDMLAAVRTIAADENTQYLELMHLPQAGRDVLDGFDPAGDGDDFAAMAAALQPRLTAAVARARAELDADEARAASLLGCAGAAPHAGCAVELRYQAPATRTHAPARTFATMAFAFALADADPRFVGVNLLGPEHHPRALRDYRLHMRMLAFFKQRHARVKLSLHAGELSAELAPPRDLRDHIGQAVTVAGAERIGHGVAIASEDGLGALLQRMARQRTAVEINLSSNAAILGVAGAAHPLALYRAAGVPVVLATDDQGVLRSDLSGEYLRAALDQGLDYRALKRIARDSLQYAFLPGASLWQDRAGGARAAACAGASPADDPDPGCGALLQASAKARAQWQLERALFRFERAPRPPASVSARTGEAPGEAR